MPPGRPNLLVLDGQGVVFDAPIKGFLSEFARKNQLNFEDVEQRWESSVRDLAWRGLIDDGQVWEQLARKKVDTGQTMKGLRSFFRPGPAIDRLARWSEEIPIWMLSNHRSAWLLPELEGFGVRQFFDRIYVSDATGYVKPELNAFRQLVCESVPAADILFVDDQQHNLLAAKGLGFGVIHADPGRDWIAAIDDALAAS